MSNLISFKSDYQPQSLLFMLVIISIHSHQVSLCQPLFEKKKKIFTSTYMQCCCTWHTKVNEGQTWMFCIVNMRQLSTICQTCRPQDMTNRRQVPYGMKICLYFVMIVYRRVSEACCVRNECVGIWEFIHARMDSLLLQNLFF